MNNESRNGFADKTLFMIGDNVKASDQETMAAEINDWMGARGEKSIVIPAPINEDGEIDEKGTLITKTIKSNIDDKLYDTYENKLANRIRKAMYALPQLLIEYETSNLGTTSGEAIVQAVNFYNEQTSSDREQVSQMFKEIFSKSANPKLRAVTDWKITPRQMNNGTTNTGATAGDQASQSE
jgi:1,6-anhydro-N-acetylmuramate kinase